MPPGQPGCAFRFVSSAPAAAPPSRCIDSAATAARTAPRNAARRHSAKPARRERRDARRPLLVSARVGRCPEEARPRSPGDPPPIHARTPLKEQGSLLLLSLGGQRMSYGGVI